MKKNSKITRATKGATAKAKSIRTIGIDLGDQTSHYCILDANGEIVSEGTMRTTEAGLGEQFRRVAGASCTPGH